jgi:hypothetical protein
MTDEASTAGWQDRFEEWVEFAKPLFKQGKDKDAWAKYPWFTTEGDPFAKPDKPVSECRFGVVTTGGYSKLRINHPGYDHRFAKEDYNANLPLDRLKELVDDGTIGSVSPDTLVLMGLQLNLGPLIRETIPEIVATFRADNVDAALLVPS